MAGFTYRIPKLQKWSWGRFFNAVAISFFSFQAGAGVGYDNSDENGSVEEGNTFESSFLMNGYSKTIDINRFNRPDSILPGEYVVDVVLDKLTTGRLKLAFKKEANSDDVHPCITRQLLKMVNVNFEILSKDTLEKLNTPSETCLNLVEIIPQASAKLDVGSMTLQLNIPQSSLLKVPKDYVDPELWNDGVTAFLSDYNINYNQSQNDYGYDNKNLFMGLRSGVNLGAWRLRYNGNVSYSDNALTGRQRHYNYIDSYLQRAVASLDSELTLGDTHSDGTVLDSFPLRGLVLASDDRMLPVSLRGYAPVVYGTASTNAHVEIRQNNNLLYETNVSAGPFSISDLSAARNGANLDVTVTESDGRVQRYTVPYGSTPTSLRKGRLRYSVAAGEYRDSMLSHTPNLMQGIVQYGLTNYVTVYSGSIVSDKYYNGTGGIALNTYWGTLGFDATYSHANFESAPALSGRSYHLSYSTDISKTNTNIGIAAYYYASKNYLTLPDSAILYDIDKRGEGVSLTSTGQEKNRLQVVINQRVSDSGSLYLSGSSQKYWGSTSYNYQYQLGYTQNIGSVNVGIMASRVYSEYDKTWQNNYMTTISIPFGNDSRAFSSTTYDYNSYTHSSNLNQSVSGVYGNSNQLTYSVGASYNQPDNNDSTLDTVGLNSNITYTAPSTTLSANASVSKNSRQGSLGMSGAIVGYDKGLVFSSSNITSGTSGLIEAEDAAGAKLLNGTNVIINDSGLAIVPNISPFAVNKIGLDIHGLSDNLSVDSTTQTAIPTAGALVPIVYQTNNEGYSAFIKTTRSDGSNIPFAANVMDESGQSVGIAGQNGVLTLSKLKAKNGVLTVLWGARKMEQCKVKYHLPDDESRRKEFRVFTPVSCL